MSLPEKKMLHRLFILKNLESYILADFPPCTHIFPTVNPFFQLARHFSLTHPKRFRIMGEGVFNKVK